MVRCALRLLIATGLPALDSGMAAAQIYPARLVRLVAPFLKLKPGAMNGANSLKLK
jgi:hypothetical protein